MQVTNQRGAAPLEIGNEFLFHCYLFPVPLPHNANPKREGKDNNGMWIFAKISSKSRIFSLFK